MAANPYASSVVVVAAAVAVAVEPPVIASDGEFGEKEARLNEEEGACVSGEQHPLDSATKREI